MIKFRLAELLEEKNKSRYWLCKETRIDQKAITKIYNNDTTQIKLETILKIINALECEIDDFMVKIDDENEDE